MLEYIDNIRGHELLRKYLLKITTFFRCELSEQYMSDIRSHFKKSILLLGL